MANQLNWKRVMEMTSEGTIIPFRRVEKSNTEWRSILDDETYHVTREKGTESPESSSLCHAVQPGDYYCACCEEHLFSSLYKFNSGTGWPSFTAPAQDGVLNYISDNSCGMTRVEVKCAVCDAHLGHVFPDGMGETGLRYCINGAALRMR